LEKTTIALLYKGENRRSRSSLYYVSVVADDDPHPPHPSEFGPWSSPAEIAFFLSGFSAPRKRVYISLDSFFEVLDLLLDLPPSAIQLQALRFLHFASLHFPAYFIDGDVVGKLTNLALTLADEALPEMLRVFATVLRDHDNTFLSGLHDSFVGAIVSALNFEDFDHLHFFPALVLTFSIDDRLICTDYIPVLRELLIHRDRRLRLTAIDCLAILSEKGELRGKMVESGLFEKIEESLVFTDPELFSETFMLINCLIVDGIPELFLGSQFLSRFWLLLGQVKPRGLKFILDFFRLVHIFDQTVILESGLLRLLFDVQRDLDFQARRAVAAFAAEVLGCVWVSDVAADAFRILAEGVELFGEGAVGGCLANIAQFMEAFPEEGERICDDIEAWDAIVQMTDSEDPEIADVAQDILDRHYWPRQDDAVLNEVHH
jgi:hypothetical protein